MGVASGDKFIENHAQREEEMFNFKTPKENKLIFSPHGSY